MLIISRSLHDLGLAAWFGGTLANAVALNAAAGVVEDDRESGRVATAGWDRWTPVNAAAIGIHLGGSVAQLVGNRDSVAADDEGMGSMSVVKTGLTVAALAATGYSRLLGRRLSSAADPQLADGTTPTADTPSPLASAARQLSALQWVIPALTGLNVVVSAVAGEQQRRSARRSGR